MIKTCKNCTTKFEIREKDAEFYKKMSVPHPSLCPECRSIRRHSFRNERILYNRKCDLTGKSIISVYDNSVPFPVYDHEAWHGDNWDAMKYGMEFDFSCPFFEQFAELYNKVPRINFMNQASENSDYCNYAYRNKNCYLIFGSHYNEDCQYGNYIWKCTSCLDNLEVIQSELIYEGIYSDGCYSCKYIEYCFNCSNCDFCYDLIGCKNCLFSSNLRNKNYYIFNKPYSKEDYENYAKKINTGSSKELTELIKKYHEVRQQAIKRHVFQVNCENCTGNDIQHSKNLYYVFNAKYAEDCAYATIQATHVKDSMDLTCIGYDDSELLYECVGNSGNHTALFCNSCWHNNETAYCEQCFDSSNLFGCIGLKHKKNCILNKQYSETDYKKMITKITEHMKKTKELGEFMPSKMSPFCYNETVANVHYPLTKEGALSKNYRWKEPNPKEYLPQTFEIKDDIKEIDDDILKKTLACKTCGKNYKITPAEFKFYKKQKLPIPRNCSDCRHIFRVKLRTGTKLYNINCSKCGVDIVSVYPNNRENKVYCEKCYLEAL